uniref:zonadhesin-like isoform X3 n=1 Tax=Styela clava TaxID=7725 RepID=UPI00193A2AB1|nr:zonadhesin-like isoform X3 [Styela clava]
MYEKTIETRLKMKILVLLIAVALLLDGTESIFPSFKPKCDNKCNKNSDCKIGYRCVKIVFCKFCWPIFTAKPPTTTTKATTPPTTPSTTKPTTKPAQTTCDLPKTSDTTDVKCMFGRKNGDMCFASCKTDYCPGVGATSFTTCRCKNGECKWDRDVSNYCRIKKTDQCKTDSDCLDASKPSCLPGRCGKQCTKRLTPPPCLGTCQTTSDCISGMICKQSTLLGCKSCVREGDTGLFPGLTKQPNCPIPELSYAPSFRVSCPKFPCNSKTGCEDNEVCCYSYRCNSAKCEKKSNSCPVGTKNQCTTDGDCKSLVEKCVVDKDGCKKCSTGFSCPGRSKSCKDDTDCNKLERCLPGSSDGCRTCASTTIHIKPTCPTPESECHGICDLLGTKTCQLGDDGCRRCVLRSQTPKLPSIPTCAEPEKECKSLRDCENGKYCLLQRSGCKTCQDLRSG